MWHRGFLVAPLAQVLLLVLPFITVFYQLVKGLVLPYVHIIMRLPYSIENRSLGKGEG
jgi:hypothetical protein